VRRVSLMPRNQRGRVYERVGINIRRFAGVSLGEPLDPFGLAEFVKIQVIEPSQIPNLSSQVVAELTGPSSSRWSAATIGLPSGWQLCILNPTHSVERVRASLMEEISHVVLGHQPTRILTSEGGVAYREYNALNEQVAYGVGAAALVPYAALVVGLMDGLTPESIAARYGVSHPLVIYRIKITMLWARYRSKAS
jgi:hypothetical protein